MGGLVSGITGKGGSSSNTSGLSGLTGLGQSALAGLNASLGNTVGGLGDTLASASSPYLQGGASQYQAGLSGQLTPAQQALTQNTLNQENLATQGTYANLGLGGSTMETQDTNANALKSLSQQEAIDFQNEQYGMLASQLGQGMLQGAGGLYNEAGNLNASAGGLLGNSQSNLNNFLNTLLGSSSSLGSSIAGGNTLSSLLGGNSSVGGLTGLDSLLGGSGLAGTSVGGSTLSSGLGSSGIGSGIADIFSSATGGSGLGADAAASGLGDALSAFSFLA